MSLVSRVLRSTELRIHGVDADEAAELFIDQAATTGQVRVIANRPGVGDVAEYAGQDPRGARHAPAEAVGAGAVRRGGHHRRVRVQQRAEGARRRDRPVPRAALPQRRGARTPSPACCCTSAIAPARCRTPTSGGPRATRSPTCSSSSPSARATWRRSAARCCGRPSPIPNGVRASTLADTAPPSPSTARPARPHVHRGSAAMPPWSVGELPAPPVWTAPELGRR